MLSLRVGDILTDNILISRVSSRLLERPLAALLKAGDTPAGVPELRQVTVDIGEVEGIAPSFVDELLLVFESVLGDSKNGREYGFTIAHPPTRLSSKFEAIARGHGMMVRAQPDGSWTFVVARRMDE